MQSRVFLTPKGELQEIVFNEQAPRQFAPPVAYFATHDAAKTADELQKERDELVASLPRLKGGARSKADHRIRLLEREIRAALEMEEAERRKVERTRERQRQKIGADSPFARQTQNRSTSGHRDGPTVKALRAQGAQAYEVKGLSGSTAIMVRK